jgi:hypothetical protein
MAESGFEEYIRRHREREKEALRKRLEADRKEYAARLQDTLDEKEEALLDVDLEGMKEPLMSQAQIDHYKMQKKLINEMREKLRELRELTALDLRR